ncbi:MAG: succinate dehydrogenase/fumarate reductase cytochrome b subunit [Arcobacter sp.]|nr:MAG: succinate dehydrogenase/fumarate reductase cytochrome b subunit [Arcobacter sp.]
MQSDVELAKRVELESLVKKSRVPAQLDYIQSATGLILGLFMWGHMLFVSSILISKDAMYFVTKMMEGEYVLGEAHPEIVTVTAIFIFIVFITHALIAIRKFPGSYKQFRVFREHAVRFKHSDTNLWFIQVITGFTMFFLGSIHLFVIMVNSDNIGPYASADRMVSGWMWPLYLLLLVAVEFHGSIGLYRLCVKWGWFEGKDAKASRKNLKKIKWAITIFFMGLGLATLAAYMKIGYEHKDKAGERYVPTYISAKVAS